MTSTSRSPRALLSFVILSHLSFVNVSFVRRRVTSRSPRTPMHARSPVLLELWWVTVSLRRSKQECRISSRILRHSYILNFGRETVRGFRQVVTHIESIEISMTWNCTWETCRVSLEYWCRQRLLYLHEEQFFFPFYFPETYSYENIGVIIGYLMDAIYFCFVNLGWNTCLDSRPQFHEKICREKRKNEIAAGEGKTSAKCPFPLILGSSWNHVFHEVDLTFTFTQSQQWNSTSDKM